MLDKYVNTINAAAQFLVNHPGSPKILCKISKNLGDSIHGLPIIKHYRTLHPNAAIAFITSQNYHGVHELNRDLSPGGLFLFPNGITDQDRLKLWPIIHQLHGIDIKLIPAINPFQALYPQNRWSYPIIADQYFANAGISDCKPLGGRRYVINVSDSEREWAKSWLSNCDVSRCIGFEYISYSHPSPWSVKQWQALFALTPGYRYIGFAGASEGLINGMVDGRGLSYRKTVALLNNIPRMITIGSGNGMLAMGAETQPKIYEIGVPENVTGKGCGYCDSEVILNPTPQLVKTRMGI